jgi:hypothetical protein
MPRLAPLTAYYLATPLFALCDYACGWSFRVAYLDPHPAGKALYYLGCTLLGLAYLRWGRGWSSLIGLFECAANALLLVLSVVLPVYGLADAVLAGGEITHPFTPLFFVNLVIAQIVVLYAFYTNPLVRRSPRLPSSW